jgi:membrane glycosyltransferase
MPVQSLQDGPRASDVRLQPGMAWRRGLLLGATGVMSLAGCAVMGRLLAAGGLSTADVGALALFGVLFTWVAFAFVSAMAGFVTLWRDRGLEPWAPQPIVFTRTALLMPTYNEDPGRILAGVQAIYEDLEARGVAEMYDLFVLSDTRDAAIARAEVTGVMRLRLRLSAQDRIFYRRRPMNLDRKAGNIADWVSRFGGAYESMIILDADSLMGADTIIRLTAAMEREPRTGLIQTLPTIIGARTLFARMQQFAGRLYGPMIAAGQDWWSGAEGNYWGHNAIIRTRAFAACAGLPHIEVGKPFAGHIMSHDFVEAALLRRGGWAAVRRRRALTGRSSWSSRCPATGWSWPQRPTAGDGLSPARSARPRPAASSSPPAFWVPGTRPLSRPASHPFFTAGPSPSPGPLGQGQKGDL